MHDLAGKTAFVTGAASGIGLGIATALALAQAGVKVMMCDVKRDALDAAVAVLQASTADVTGVFADVSLKAQLQAAADATIGRYGKGISSSTTPGSAAAVVMANRPMPDGTGRSGSI